MRYAYQLAQILRARDTSCHVSSRNLLARLTSSELSAHQMARGARVTSHSSRPALSAYGFTWTLVAPRTWPRLSRRCLLSSCFVFQCFVVLSFSSFSSPSGGSVPPALVTRQSRSSRKGGRNLFQFVPSLCMRVELWGSNVLFIAVVCQFTTELLWTSSRWLTSCCEDALARLFQLNQVPV